MSVDEVVLDWIDTTRTANPAKWNNPLATHFQNLLWPAGMAYASSLNPIFACELKSLEELEERPLWLLRDGLVPLRWFFKLHPSPPRLRPNQRILVDESLADFVPEAWRDCTGSYRLASTRPILTRGPVLLAGLAKDSYIPHKSLERRLNSLSIARRKQKGHLAYLPARFSETSGAETEVFHGRFYGLLHAKIPAIEFCNWPQLIARESFAGLTLLDLNQKLLIADSYLSHLPLSRGASPLESERAGKGERYVPLSLSHGMIVNSSLAPALKRRKHDSDFIRFTEERLTELMNSTANLEYPWESLLKLWSRATHALC
jgi:hypothetical protein